MFCYFKRWEFSSMFTNSHLCAQHRIGPIHTTLRHLKNLYIGGRIRGLLKSSLRETGWESVGCVLLFQNTDKHPAAVASKIVDHHIP